MLLDYVETIGGKASVLGEVTEGVDRWQSQFRSESNDQLLIGCIEGAWGHDEATIRYLNERTERRFDLCCTMQRSRCYRHPEGGGGCLGCVHERDMGGDVRAVDECYAAHAGGRAP